MEHQCGSSSDRISELPNSIVQTILMFLPLRDMVRTSILSRNWRFQWVTVPQLVFNLEVFRNSYDIVNMNILFGILLLHQGPILKFKLDMSGWSSRSAIDKIIPLLSRNGIQDLTLATKCDKIPSSIFKCLELKHLRLTSSVFKPLTLVGFNKLISVELIDMYLDSNVTIPCGPLLESLKLVIRTSINPFSVDAPNLKSLYFRGCIYSIGFMNTPLVKVLSLKCISVPSMILRYWPLVANLYMYLLYDHHKVVGDSSTRQNKLKVLKLDAVEIKDMDELSSTIMWIRNQPNLEKLKFTKLHWGEFELNFQTLQYQDYSLKKLREVEFEFISDMRPCVEFIKFLLAISPELEKLYIKPLEYCKDVNWYKSLLELTCSRRASPKAEIVFLGLH